MNFIPRLIAFLRAHSARHFKNWSDEDLTAWLGWYHMQRAIGVVLDGEEVVGVGIGYPCRADQVMKQNNVPDPDGDYYKVEHVCVTRPRAIIGLMLMVNQQCPTWKSKDFVGLRAGKVRLYGLQDIRRLVKNAARQSCEVIYGS